MKLILCAILFVLAASALPQQSHHIRDISSVQEWGFANGPLRLAYEHIEYMPRGIPRVELNFPQFVRIFCYC